MAPTICPVRSRILARVAQGEGLDAASRACNINPDDVWRALWKEATFREAYQHALWTNSQAQMAKLEREAIELQGDPDCSDIIDNWDLDAEARETLCDVRISDHNNKRKHVMAMLVHWRWRCQHLAPDLFGMDDVLPLRSDMQQAVRVVARDG